MTRLDNPALLDEVAGHLSRLIQFDTRNPPGNELPLAKYLEETLAAAGIETYLFEPVPNRAAVVARIRGTGQKLPVLIAAHMDVVDVEHDKWQHQPLGGEIDDGYLYGRGAIDDKGMLAVNLVTMLRLKRELIDAGVRLERDVVFVATSDEEMGGDIGLAWLMQHHADLIAAEYALNEGGRIRVVDGKTLYAAVQTTEKVSHVLEIRARGQGGHASVPLPDNAIARLTRAVARIAQHREPIRLLPTTRQFFTRLSKIWPEPQIAAAMADIGSTDETIVARGCTSLCQIPMYDAVLRTGISPTIVAGGSRHNVIPTEATAVFSVRTLPNDPIAGVIDRLREAVGDPTIEFDLLSTTFDAPVSNHESEMFAAIGRAIADEDREIVVVPYMSTGATESALLRSAGVQTYGLLPFPLEGEDEGRMHGHDERVPLDSLLFGARVVFNIVRNIAH